MHCSTRGFPIDWAKHGVKIVHSDELDLTTPQTSGMTRAAAITHARAGASKLWAGTMVVQPDAKTGPHHHGELDYPPDWMLFDVDTNQNVNPKYYDALARYYVRYLQEYEKNGIFVDYLSLFNE